MYIINEIFFSAQGEGANTGEKCVFLRFAGCDEKCGYCDTDHFAGSQFSKEMILEEIKKYETDKIVLTGGEPTLQIDVDLLRFLKLNKYYLFLETNGNKKLDDLLQYLDWITLSPKNRDFKQLFCDELKMVYYGQEIKELNYYRDKVSEFYKIKYFYLQPESNKKEFIDMIMNIKGWRLGLQCHKLINMR